MKKQRILVVDDELSIIKFTRANLEAAGYEIFTAMNGVEALQTFEAELPDMVILDIKMPKMDGFEVCRQIREWSQVPIIMLSALGSEENKVQCLDLGADDYITKPFGKNELIARIKAVMRRIDSSTPPVRSSLTFGALTINFAQRKVSINNGEIQLTPIEFNLLQELVLNEGKVLTHTHLLNKVWGADYQDEKEYLHVFIPRLRAKLGDNPSDPIYIKTVSGIGYQFTGK
jgi:two-component system KDP operon response regulator KdpE